MKSDQTEMVVREGVAGRVVPWLLSVASLGFAGYLYGMVYRPLAEDVRKKAVELREQKALARDGKREADELKSDLGKALDQLKQTRSDLARTAETSGENEKLLAKLQKELKDSGVEIVGGQGKITVTMVDRILFNSGEADLTEHGEILLRKFGSVLKGLDSKLIQVSGHTDAAPIKSELKDLYPTNWELSTARATNVVRFLQDEVGVNAKHLMAAGFGPYRPVASNMSATGRAKNRRIEILLLPEPKVVRGDFSAELAAAGSDPQAASAEERKARPARMKDRDRLRAISAARSKQPGAKKLRKELR